MHFALVLALFVATTVVAYPQNPQRIVGGSVTTINQYPYGTSMLYSWDLVSYWQGCGGGIITSTAILSAAHCFHGDAVNRWRARVGSTWANSGGTIHTLRSIIIHPSYNPWTFDNDIAVLRTASNINYIANTVAPTSIAGPAYNLPDNAAVWGIGWGLTQFHGQPSEQLRHVQVWVFNQATCRQRFAEIGLTITDNMMCSGWLDVGGRGQCNGDSGSPVLHNNVIVGVCSWGIECATARFGSVNVRVSRYTAWIQGAAA